MRCTTCGNQTPDDSYFCLNCGNATKGLAPQTVRDWAYKDFVLTWNPGVTGWVSAETYTEPAARLYFWQNYESVIMPDLQKMIDEGWRPTTDLGPSCIQLRYYKSHEGTNWFPHILATFASWGIWLFIIPFMGSWKFQMIGFHLRLRRPQA